jgi:hypothetical protein
LGGGIAAGLRFPNFRGVRACFAVAGSLLLFSPQLFLLFEKILVAQDIDIAAV